MPQPPERVAVLGLGLIGGSVVQAIRAGSGEAWGYDPDPATVDAARAAGIETSATVAAAVADADLVVLAMPLPQVADTLSSIAPALDGRAVVTDVGTLKQPVRELVARYAPRLRFVGGHPLAGTEDSGFAAADPLLLRDAPWVLTLDPGTDLGAWLDVAAVVCRLGARPVPVTSADQDATVARVIGLPHMLAEALALTGLAGGPLGLSLAAGSYRSTSRVARTRPELVATWCDANPALVGALDDVIERLQATRTALATGGSVLELARAGHAARMDWEHRRMTAVDVEASVDALLAHGRDGGWITAVEPGLPGLRGMRPADRRDSA